LHLRSFPGSRIDWAALIGGRAAFHIALDIVVPQIWLQMLRHAFPGLAPNNSSKPTPLRGAA